MEFDCLAFTQAWSIQLALPGNCEDLARTPKAVKLPHNVHTIGCHAQKTCVDKVSDL